MNYSILQVKQFNAGASLRFDKAVSEFHVGLRSSPPFFDFFFFCVDSAEHKLRKKGYVVSKADLHRFFSNEEKAVEYVNSKQGVGLK